MARQQAPTACVGTLRPASAAVAASRAVRRRLVGRGGIERSTSGLKGNRRPHGSDRARRETRGISEGRIPAVSRATPTGTAAPFAARVAPLRQSVVARAASFAAPIRMMPIATRALAGVRTLRERQLWGLRRENALVAPLADGLAGALARHDRDSVPGIGNPLGELRLAGISGSQTEPISGREETVLPPALHASLSPIVVLGALPTVRPAATDFQTARVVGRDGIEPSTSGVKVGVTHH
jgi:hypothetical protein